MQLSASENATYSTVRIALLDDTMKPTGGSGTAFIVSFPQITEDGNGLYPILVTNKHVVQAAKNAAITFTKRDITTNEPIDHETETVKFSSFKSFWIYHPNDKIDLCVAPLAPIWNQYPVFIKSFSTEQIPTKDQLDKFTAFEEIVTIGYPIGVFDKFNNMPISRKGMTATRLSLDYEGQPQFLADIASFPGCSGSPVIAISEGVHLDKKENSISLGGVKLFLLGVIYGGVTYKENGELKVIPCDTTVVPVYNMRLNLAAVLRAEAILDFKKLLPGCN